jgi:hypothetical protein
MISSPWPADGALVLIAGLPSVPRVVARVDVQALP